MKCYWFFEVTNGIGIRQIVAILAQSARRAKEMLYKKLEYYPMEIKYMGCEIYDSKIVSQYDLTAMY